MRTGTLLSDVFDLNGARKAREAAINSDIQIKLAKGQGEVTLTPRDMIGVQISVTHPSGVTALEVAESALRLLRQRA